MSIMHVGGKPRQRFTCVSAVVPLALIVVMPALCASQKLVTFDAPNSSQSAYLGTAAASINLWGTIVGDVTDDNGGVHGYLRTADGKFTEFDAPGANPSPGYPCLYFAGGTCPTAINDLGVIAGWEGDANGVYHGFVRTPNGKITVFDAPGAGTASNQGTLAYAINDQGSVTGSYLDGGNVYHGFVRSANGNVLSFDSPEAGAGAYLGTEPESISNRGEVAGSAYDANGFGHGFVRYADGKITTFDPPGSAGSYYGVDYVFVSDLGVVAGSYWQGAGNVSLGFEGMPNRNLSTFQVPRAGTAAFDGAYTNAINLEGVTVGYVTDTNVENHSFVRAANGRVFVFDVPGQMAVPGSDFGSAAYGINAMGVVAGRWHDANAVLHAFIWAPWEH
jgi:hypothetical protein